MIKNTKNTTNGCAISAEATFCKKERNHSIRHFMVLLIFAVIFAASCSPEVEKHAITANQENSDYWKLDRSTDGILESAKPSVISANDNDIVQIEAKAVSKEINGRKIRMFGYNGQIPGQTIKARQGSSIEVNFTNSIGYETTIHWHGIRIENEYDGVPDITQKPVKDKESFVYRLSFPDSGIYWYHPHLREDFQQELGLYGAIIVEPENSDYYNKADNEMVLFLDDIKIIDDVSLFDESANFALMGRFGNRMLINGEENFAMTASKNTVTRFYIINSANARPFNLSIFGHNLKIIGSDSERFEKEYFADSLIIAPSERYIVEVYFEETGVFEILNKNPFQTYLLGKIAVSDSEAVSGSDNASYDFFNLRKMDILSKKFDELRKYSEKEPDYKVTLTMEMDAHSNDMRHGMMGGRMSNSINGIEWEDQMPMMNSMSDSNNVKWIIKDSKTGKENMDINYDIKKGDYKKIRIFNDPNSMHPMQHPIHIHGQRFAILSVDGIKNENMGWKDTVLVPAGSTVDILVEFSNPGKWMMHCHIPEHLESGMMSMFTVV